MEKILLGLLMLRGMSIYDIKSTIDAKFSSICSSSSGSIHRAIRLLLEKEKIDCSEDGRRKIYYITEKGRKDFTGWITSPINHEKAKNIEASKLFFLGMAPTEDAKKLINGYISDLQIELAELTALMELCTANTATLLQQSESIILEDCYNTQGLKKCSDRRDMKQKVQDIYIYQMELLQYGIDSLHFEIDWYLKLQARRNLL